MKEASLYGRSTWLATAATTIEPRLGPQVAQRHWPRIRFQLEIRHLGTSSEGITLEPSFSLALSFI
jgi:hypothetical protein